MKKTTPKTQASVSPYEPSSYEKLRVEKVRRNQEHLASLGLTKLLDEEKNEVKHDEYDVEEIVGHQCFANKTHRGWYLCVKWVGYEDPTWEPMKKLKAQLPEEVNTYVEAHKEDFNCCNSITRAVKKKKPTFEASKESQEKPPLEASQANLPNRVATKKKPLSEAIQENVPPRVAKKKKVPLEAKKKLPLRAIEPPSEACKMKHQFQTNYKPEENAGYCKPPHYLAGKMCAGGCSGLFTHDIKSARNEVGGQLFIKPTIKQPVWTCVGQEKGCSHALCSLCFCKTFLT